MNNNIKKNKKYEIMKKRCIFLFINKNTLIPYYLLKIFGTL